MHNRKDFDTGELTVTGRDFVEIQLDGLPRHIEVHFKDPDEPAPCDIPQSRHMTDRLWWHLHQRSHWFKKDTDYKLFIRWDVSTTREIVWSVDY